jgi:pyrroloquinoline quinone biosynthesis protein B
MKITFNALGVFLSLLYTGLMPVGLSAQRLIVLGTVQDAGAPHIGCTKPCCRALFKKPDPGRKVVSLGLIDERYGKAFLVEATPDIAAQLEALKARAPFLAGGIPDGILLTHAHIGHYAGLMYLGREALGARQASVFAMPRMRAYLENNGPWSQLVGLGNIALRSLQGSQEIVLTPDLKVTPFLVPHRDEFSETVGFRICGKDKAAIFLPDIDKWEKWDTDITALLATVDYAFLDATFFDAAEIGYRDIREIPHPFVVESMAKFKGLSPREKAKIHFIHFNHTNPLLDPNSRATRQVRKMGFKVSRIYDEVRL